MKIQNRQTLGTMMALVGGTCWGFSGCCGQFLFEQKEVQAPWLVTVRLFFAGLILIMIGFRLNGRQNLNIFKRKQDALHLLLFAVFGITFCQFTYFMAIQASNAGTATVLQYLSPVLILMVVCIRGKDFPKDWNLGQSAFHCWGPLSSAPMGTSTPSTLRGRRCSGGFWQLSAP